MISGVTTPRIDIDVNKIMHNAKVLRQFYNTKNIDIIGVTKMACGEPIIAKALVKSGINILADSRVSNIKRMKEAGIQAQFLLLRTPLPSQIDDVVKYCDFSLNSEISVIKSLSKSSLQHRIIHKIILMIELGDLREGIMPNDLETIIKITMKLEGVNIVGIGVNLACNGGIKPNEDNMSKLSNIARRIKNQFGLKLDFVSGGNSANYNWFKYTEDVGEINNLRIGESIYLGCDPIDRKNIPKLFYDAFTLVTEVIELKIKPSLPYGEVGQDAFGNIPIFIDQGDMLRGILGIGIQDILVSGITPKSNIKVIGMSSDHIIVNIKDSNIHIGQEVEFNLNYGALLSAMTSPYIIKNYLNGY